MRDPGNKVFPNPTPPIFFARLPRRLHKTLLSHFEHLKFLCGNAFNCFLFVKARVDSIVAHKAGLTMLYNGLKLR